VQKTGQIYGSQMLIIEDFDDSKKPDWDTMAKRIFDKGQDYGMMRRDGFAATFPGRNVAMVNMTHIETPLEPLAASRLSLDGQSQADGLLRFLRENYAAAFGNAAIRSYGQPGIRMTRWIVGRDHLTADAVRQGVRSDDAIARCSWPIELHDRPEGYVWEPFPDDHLHYVPFGSLVPAEGDNIVAAGRCIDGDTAALSSVRVMGPCIAMGAAAAHALDLAGSGSVQQVDIAARRLQHADQAGAELDRALDPLPVCRGAVEVL
jgi:hypothetical protein